MPATNAPRRVHGTHGYVRISEQHCRARVDAAWWDRVRQAQRMELFLNVCWLMLALAAVLGWRQQSQSTRRRSPFVCLLALSCTLILLFPIISESDDLHAMRQEMEESSVKVKAGEGDRSSQASPKLHAPALPASAQAIRPVEVLLGLVESRRLSKPLVTAGARAHNRAPPSLSL